MEIAKLINVNHEVVEGKTDVIERIIQGPWEDKNFINIAPWETLKEEHFFVQRK